MKLPHTLLALALCSALTQAQDKKPKNDVEAKERDKAAVALKLKDQALDGKSVAAAEIEKARDKAVTLLVELQESLDTKVKAKSEWPYEGVYRVDGEIPVGYRIGGTSIASTALLEACGDKRPKKVDEALERALAFVLKMLADPLMTTEFTEGYDVRGWGHAYALEFLLCLREHQAVPKAHVDEVEAWIDRLVEILQATEIKSRGGWNYSRPAGDASSASTFMTAPTLQILFRAAAGGESVQPEIVERALKTIEDARLDSGTFQYGSSPGKQRGTGFEALSGAVGRMTVCETTLFLAGRGSVERIQTSIDAFFEHWEWLEARRRQPGTHPPPFMVAPYYYFYAHRYVAQAIEFLPESERTSRRDKLDKLLWAVREESGGWNDRVFERSENFGTAMTLLALLERARARPAGWTGRPVTGTK